MADGSGPGYCSDIAFIPNTNGLELLAVGSPGIWWSGNQGVDWIELSGTGFYTVSFADATHGMLAGNNTLTSFELVSK